MCRAFYWAAIAYLRLYVTDVFRRRWRLKLHDIDANIVDKGGVIDGGIIRYSEATKQQLVFSRFGQRDGLGGDARKAVAIGGSALE